MEMDKKELSMDEMEQVSGGALFRFSGPGDRKIVVCAKCTSNKPMLLSNGAYTCPSCGVRVPQEEVNFI